MDALYSSADAVIKTFVFGVAQRLGWELRACTRLARSLPRAVALTPPCAAPVTAGLPFVDSPTGLLLCLAAYLAVVAMGLVLLSGPAPAQKRTDPAWLRMLVLMHNVFLVSLSIFMSGGCV